MDPGVGQREPLALGPGHQEHGPEACGPPHGDRGDGRLDVLHGVVDGQPRRDRAAGRVHVHLDLLVRVLSRQEDQLGDDQVGHHVVDGPAHDHDPVPEQPRVDVERPLAVSALVLYDRRHPAHRHRS